MPSSRWPQAMLPECAQRTAPCFGFFRANDVLFSGRWFGRPLCRGKPDARVVETASIAFCWESFWDASLKEAHAALRCGEPAGRGRRRRRRSGARLRRRRVAPIPVVLLPAVARVSAAIPELQLPGAAAAPVRRQPGGTRVCVGASVCGCWVCCCYTPPNQMAVRWRDVCV
jgi:hypothetical protein